MLEMLPIGLMVGFLESYTFREAGFESWRVIGLRQTIVPTDQRVTQTPAELGGVAMQENGLLMPFGRNNRDHSA